MLNFIYDVNIRISLRATENKYYFKLKIRIQLKYTAILKIIFKKN